MGIETKKVFSKIGFATTISMVLISVVQIALGQIIKLAAPSVANSGWISYILMGVSYYLIGMPVFCLLMKGLPSGEKRESQKLSVGNVLKYFCITYAFMIICNLFTMLIMFIVSLIKGGQVVNPIANVVSNSNLLGTLIFVGILSPIVEEFMFRKVMLDKLRIYGDKVAIITTALMFGLFHGNFSQFFYATAIGLIFGYVVIKTGSIKYSIALHIMVNMMGSVIGMAAIGNFMALFVFGLVVWIFVITGIVLFFKNRKKISLAEPEVAIEKGQVFKTTVLNPGMIVYFVFMLLNMIAIVLM